MSFGKMNKRIIITKEKKIIDDEGFSTTENVLITNIHAYREGRHGSKRWANRASFCDATDLFVFRAIPNVKITTDMCIEDNNEKFEIVSAENVKGKGMYIEILARSVKPSG